MTEATTFQKSTAREYFESLAITVILALFGTTFIVQAFKIPTPSMEDNLLVGDHLLVNKFAFGAEGSFLDSVLPFKEIQRGDIIVFKYPKDLTKHFVKRVIGVPGDHVKIVDKQVYVNNELIEDTRYNVVHKGAPGYFEPGRDYLPPKSHSGIYFGSDGDANWYEKYLEGDSIVVPPRSYFAMGDNRDNSLDSRYWGFVPRENIVGKPLVIYWSYETDDESRETSYRERATQLWELAKGFVSKTRWDRTLRIIR